MTNHRLNRGELEALIAILNSAVHPQHNVVYDEYGDAVHKPVDMTGLRVKLAQQLAALN
jgi:hypothetical protein